MQLATHFELKQLVGQGAAGEVYRAVERRTGRDVAVKILRAYIRDQEPDLVERFLREGEILRHLNHPNIVEVIGTLQDGDDYTIIMEYVDGGSLADVIQNSAPLPLEQVLSIALELSDALTRAHHLNVIHRDLKPANVLLDTDGTPKLTDFGIARVVDRSPITQTGSFMGTIAYVPPEGLNNQRLDERADIWAFGVMLFEMLTGNKPFMAEHSAAVIYSIMTRPVPDLEALRPDLPIAFVDLIYRMLDKDPNARLSSVRQVAAELEAIIRDLGIRPSRKKITERLNTYHDLTSAIGGPRHNLPAHTMAFVGREAELQLLDQLLADPDVRLLTIVGPGGIGKTRLSQECAIRQLPHFANGVYFVGLSAISTIENIVSAIADAVDFQFSEKTGEKKQQLLSYLYDKNMLLVMDNFEHLLDGAPLISEILQQASNTKVLTTSREKLNLSGEAIFTLVGMAYTTRETSEEALRLDAVQLFYQSAKRAKPDFEITNQDVPHVLNICRMVQGTPLGIVLAAAWAEMLSLAEIAEEIRQSVDFLETEARDVPERHRSIRAVFEYSWNMLSEAERETFMKLSVFRGGFTRSAAQTIANASLRSLTGLVNKSILRRTPNSGRYDVHELLREYASERLGDLANPTVDVHRQYFMEFLIEREADMKGRRQMPALAEIDADFDNIRAAWMLSLDDADQVDAAIEVLFIYCSARHRHLDAYYLLAASAERTDDERLWARLTARSELFRDPHPDSVATVEACLEIARAYDDLAEIAFTLMALGYVQGGTGDYAIVISTFRESLAIYEELDNTYYIGQLLSNLGLYHALLDERDISTDYFDRSHALQSSIGDEIGAAVSINRNRINTLIRAPE